MTSSAGAEVARKQQPLGHLTLWLALVFLCFGTGTYHSAWHRVDIQHMLADLARSVTTSIFLSVDCVAGCELGVERFSGRAFGAQMGEATQAIRRASCPL